MAAGLHIRRRQQQPHRADLYKPRSSTAIRPVADGFRLPIAKSLARCPCCSECTQCRSDHRTALDNKEQTEEVSSRWPVESTQVGHVVRNRTCPGCTDTVHTPAVAGLLAAFVVDCPRRVKMKPRYRPWSHGH